MKKRGMIVLAAMGLSLVACGSGDGGGDGVASLGTTDGTATDSASESDGAATDTGADADGAALEAPEDIEEAMALFQECMEDRGVETPDGVVVSGDGDETIAVGAGPVDVFNGNDGSDGGSVPDDPDANSDDAPLTTTRPTTGHGWGRLRSTSRSSRRPTRRVAATWRMRRRSST